MIRWGFLILALVIGFVGCASQQTKRSPPVETSMPFALQDNRIFIDVEINGKGPFAFIFDTGGARSNTLTPEVAKQLNLTVTEGGVAHGAGNRAVQSGIAKVQRVRVGDLQKDDQTFTVLDLSTIKAAFGFARLDGIIGFDISKDSVLCIDFEQQVLSFRSESSECFAAVSATILPFRMKGKTPVIKGYVNGIAGELVINTGDRSAFSLFQKFAKESELEKHFDGKPEVISGVGIGGPIPARISSLTEIRLGGSVDLNNVMTRLPSMESGYFATDVLMGSLGNEVLRRFNIILNYPRKQLTLIPNAHFNDEYKFVPSVMK